MRAEEPDRIPLDYFNAKHARRIKRAGNDDFWPGMLMLAVAIAFSGFIVAIGIQDPTAINDEGFWLGAIVVGIPALVTLSIGLTLLFLKG